MKKHVGIVLKKYCFDRPTFSIFDRYDGKITCVVDGDRSVIPGALISYFVAKQTSRYFITGIRILDLPLAIARKDILLLHHLLELCFYFLPHQGVVDRVFDQVMFFYQYADQLRTLLHKKLFLFKLMVSFGFYTGHAPLSIQLFHQLSSESIDTIMRSPLHLEIERDIDAWLYSCIGAHPQAKKFKTVRFLKQIGCYETM